MKTLPYDLFTPGSRSYRTLEEIDRYLETYEMPQIMSLFQARKTVENIQARRFITGVLDARGFDTGTVKAVLNKNDSSLAAYREGITGFERELLIGPFVEALEELLDA